MKNIYNYLLAMFKNITQFLKSMVGNTDHSTYGLIPGDAHSGREGEEEYDIFDHKPNFPRRSDFLHDELHKYRQAILEYDHWVDMYKRGSFVHISKDVSGLFQKKGTTYINPARANRLPPKVRKYVRRMRKLNNAKQLPD